MYPGFLRIGGVPPLEVDGRQRQDRVRLAGASQVLHTRVSGTQPLPGYDGVVSEQTILVVDDEEAIAEAVRARLESEGYRGVVAGDGPEAIEANTEHHPSLVVLDL